MPDLLNKEILLCLSHRPAAAADFSAGAVIVHNPVVIVIDGSATPLPLLSSDAYYRFIVGPVGYSFCCQFTEMPLFRISKSLCVQW